LAFVRLPYPHPVTSRLIDENVFYNFDTRLQAAMAGTEDEPPLDHRAIVGVIGEHSEEKLVTETTRIDNHAMFHDYGDAGNFRIGNDGFDLFDLELFHHNESVNRPGSYGGLSGAGVWAVGDEPGTTKRLLFGIAFWENGWDENGKNLIVCHGPECIYGRFIREIAAHYADFRMPS
jgi:hypothetical protein